MIFFITGIDTDTGKSIATGMLARSLLQQGRTVITQKLAQTGQVNGISQDIEIHRCLMEIPLQKEDEERLTCPYCFSYPSSPDFAARLEGQTMNPTAVFNAAKELEKRYEYVLLEGAGGFLVPLMPDFLTADFVQQYRFPLILVTSGKLGSINHTLLTLEAIRSRNIPLLGLVFNHFPPVDTKLQRDTLEFFYRYCLSIVELPLLNFQTLPDIDWSAINYKRESESTFMAGTVDL